MNDIKISVIIGTRNRPRLFQKALTSVLRQTYENIEVIVVNDGGENIHLQSYKEIEKKMDSKVRFLYLPSRKRGHGPSFVRNTAAHLANGNFLAFLDDDDEWTDKEHLERFISTYSRRDSIEVYFTNQLAVYPDGTHAEKPIWLENLISRINEMPRITKSAVIADVDWLLQGQGFAHLNCIVVKKALFESINGFDESLRYEEDKDFYWRLLDKSKFNVFERFIIGVHNIPCQRSSASSSFTELEIKITQLQIAEKNLLLASNNSLSKKCKAGVFDACKNLSLILETEGRYRLSAYYTKKALVAQFSTKWFLFFVLQKAINIFR